MRVAENIKINTALVPFVSCKLNRRNCHNYLTQILIEVIQLTYLIVTTDALITISGLQVPYVHNVRTEKKTESDSGEPALASSAWQGPRRRWCVLRVEVRLAKDTRLCPISGVTRHVGARSETLGLVCASPGRIPIEGGCRDVGS